MKTCCSTEGNLEVSEETHQTVIRKCKVCGARHIEVTLDPGSFGITGTGVGA